MAPLLLLAFALSAQDKPPETCTLSGTVVNSVTGEPLNKVEVRLEAVGRGQSTGAVTSTDSEGRFTMVEVEPGSYHLGGRRNGYLETAYGARRTDSDGTILRLEPGQVLSDLKLKLMPEAVIAGTIRDSDGEPLADVRVVVARIAYEDGKPLLDGCGGAETDDLGHYRIRYLQPGKYYICARPSRQNYRIDRSPHGGTREDTVSTVYPGSADPALAAAIEVRTGAHLTGIDITLLRVPTFAVSGSVTAAGGAPGTSIALRPHNQSRDFDGFDLHTVTRNRQGDFEFRGVPPGSYDLIARSGDLMGQSPVQVGSANVEGIRLAIRPGAKVRVHVDAEGETRPDLTGMHAILSGSLRSAPMLGVNANPTMWGERDSTVMPDHYQVNVTPPKGFYVKSIRAKETDVLAEGLTVEPGGSHDVQVLLGDDGGQVSGPVSDSAGNPDTGATVVLVPEPRLRNRAHLFLTAATDQYGRYEFSSVPPGEYKVFAWDVVEPGIWFDPDFLREQEKQGVDVTVRARGTETAKVQSGSLEAK